MGWLLGYTVGSLAAAFVVVKIFDYLVSGVADNATNAARSVVFISTWAGVTAKSGMRGFSKSAGRLRLKNSATKDKLARLAKKELK